MSVDVQSLLARLTELLPPAKGPVLLIDYVSIPTIPTLSPALTINHAYPWYPVNQVGTCDSWNSIAGHVYGPTNPGGSTPTVDLIVLESDFPLGPFFPVSDRSGSPNGYPGVWQGLANGSSFTANVSKPYYSVEIFAVSNLPSGTTFRLAFNPFTPSSNVTISNTSTANQNLSEVNGSPINLGQSTKSASLPVTIASDQSLGVQGLTPAGASATESPLLSGAQDASGNKQPLLRSGTGGLQTTPDTINNQDDNAASTAASPYPAQQTFTASGSPTSCSFTFPLSMAGPAAAALGSVELGIELGVGHATGISITSATIAFTDTVGSTSNSGRTYNLYNTPATNVNSLPSLSIADGSEAQLYLPIVDRGGFKSAVLTLNFSGGATTSGTVKVQARFNPYTLPVGPEYLVWGNLTNQNAPTNVQLFQAPGVNNRLWLIAATVSNATAGSAGNAKIVNNDTNKTPFDEGTLGAPGGFKSGPYYPYGVPASAQNQAVNLTGTATAIDAWALFRIGA